MIVFVKTSTSFASFTWGFSSDVDYVLFLHRKEAKETNTEDFQTVNSKTFGSKESSVRRWFRAHIRRLDNKAEKKQMSLSCN